MKSPEVAQDQSNKRPNVARRAGRAVVKFVKDTQENSLETRRQQERTAEYDRNLPKNRAAIEKAKAETDQRTDSYGEFARVFSKIRDAQSRVGDANREIRVVPDEEDDKTFAIENRAIIVQDGKEPWFLSEADSLLNGNNKGLVAEKGMGVAPMGTGINLGHDVDVFQVRMARRFETDPNTSKTQEQLSLILEGTYVDMGRYSRDTMLTATFDHENGAQPVWSQSVRADVRGASYQGKPATWGNPFEPTPETIAAALSYVEQLVPQSA